VFLEQVVAVGTVHSRTQTDAAAESKVVAKHVSSAPQGFLASHGVSSRQEPFLESHC
jgi:hypothetical protein